MNSIRMLYQVEDPALAARKGAPPVPDEDHPIRFVMLITMAFQDEIQSMFIDGWPLDSVGRVSLLLSVAAILDPEKWSSWLPRTHVRYSNSEFHPESLGGGKWPG